MSVVFATQLTAVATLALAVLALATAVLALLAWRKQSREVSDQAEMLRLQADALRQVSADREREARERRRAQAVQVYMWDTHDNVELVYHIRNTSQRPVYDFRLEWLDAEPDGTGVRHQLREDPLMPGEEHTCSWLLADIPPRISTIHAIFRDSAGNWWAMRPSEEPGEWPPVTDSG